jgi:hypothetical protein
MHILPNSCVRDKETMSETWRKLGKLETLIWRLKNRTGFHLKKKLHQIENLKQGESRLCCRDEERSKEKAHQEESSGGCRNRKPNERTTGGKIGTKRWQLEWAGAKLRFSAWVGNEK